MGLKAWVLAIGTALAALLASPLSAQSPRDLLTQAAFGAQNHAAALAGVRRAQAMSLATLAHDPGNQEAAVIAAVAQGYVAKLTGDRGEALKARRQLDDAVRRFPRDAEAQLGQGAWHLAVVHRVGGLLGRIVGAQRGAGIAALKRAVALDSDRPFVLGIAGMMLIESDPANPLGRAWLDAAARAAATGTLDRTVQRSAARVAAALRTGDAQAARNLADRLLPFGWYRPA